VIVRVQQSFVPDGPSTHARGSLCMEKLCVSAPRLVTSQVGAWAPLPSAASRGELLVQLPDRLRVAPRLPV
jgi:hypothetical protein